MLRTCRLFAQTQGATDDHAHTHPRSGRGDDGGRTPSHLRLLARHRVRMVRLLSLRHAGAVLRRAVLPAGQRHRGAALGVRDLCGRLPGAPVRRHYLRPHRRPRRPQIHLPGHHRGDGRRDLRGRPAAHLRHHRLARADPAGHAAPAAGPRARRRVRRRRDLRGRARAPQRARLCHELHPDHRDARLLPGAAGDRGRPLLHRRHDLRRLGLAHPVPGVARSCWCSRSISGSSSTNRRCSSA